MAADPLPHRFILGLPFFTGTLAEAVQATFAGGLVLAPSGPGLAMDYRQSAYRKALAAGDLLLPDSGAMVLFWNLRNVGRRSAQVGRLSGLRYLQGLLAAPETKRRRSFWVMPNAEEGAANLRWLRSADFDRLAVEDTYVAPFYAPGRPPQDPELLQRLESRRPDLVFLNVGGGTQEPLGAWLKQNLSYRPAIICTGAAIAFLTGQQAAIPGWADAFYLGWLMRIGSAPRRFLPRYLKSIGLAWLVLRYGEAAPALGPRRSAIDA